MSLFFSLLRLGCCGEVTRFFCFMPFTRAEGCIYYDMEIVPCLGMVFVFFVFVFFLFLFFFFFFLVILYFWL